MRKTVISLLNYIGCIGLALFVTFVIEGTIGMILTYALVIALVVSLIMTLAVIRYIGVTPVLSSSAVSKADSVFCDVKLTNISFLPSSVMEVEIEASAHFSAQGEAVLKGTVAGKGTNTLRFGFTAIHSGKAHLKIKSVKLTDFLGIFSFKIKVPEELTDLTVAIYPDIPDAFVQTSLVKTSSMFMSSDDEEEESDEVSSVPTGLAGYDHREYVAGDPLKRINWKASSKRDILLVRLDERIKGSSRTLLLDCPVENETEAVLTIRDNVIEGALALLMSLLSEGRDCVFLYCKQGLWMSAEIHTDADVFALQDELSDFEPSEATQVLPDDLQGSSKALICFTAATADSIASVESLVSRNPDTMIISSYASSLPAVSQNQWVMTDEFALEKV